MNEPLDRRPGSAPHSPAFCPSLQKWGMSSLVEHFRAGLQLSHRCDRGHPQPFWIKDHQSHSQGTSSVCSWPHGPHVSHSQVWGLALGSGWVSWEWQADLAGSGWLQAANKLISASLSSRFLSVLFYTSHHFLPHVFSASVHALDWSPIHSAPSLELFLLDQAPF